MGNLLQRQRQSCSNSYRIKRYSLPEVTGLVSNDGSQPERLITARHGAIEMGNSARKKYTAYSIRYRYGDVFYVASHYLFDESFRDENVSFLRKNKPSYLWWFDRKSNIYATRQRASTSTRWHFAFGLCCHSNKTVHWLQIRPSVHK